jgi:hypothetical protein
MTHDQLNQLSDECAQHGDILGAAIAAKAAGQDVSGYDLSPTERSRVNAMTAVEATAECDEMVRNSGVNQYRIAFVKADGSWDVVESFNEHSDADANEYAERNYADRDWYVLDSSGNNVNG